MNLELATEKKSEELIQFYKNISLRGPVELQVNRIDNYFTPYQIHGPQNLTYILTEKNKIEGAGSFILRDVYLQDKVTKVAFGRDLRISSHRNAIIEWGNHFLPLIQELKNKYQVEYFFTNISNADLPALNTFVRPRSLKRPLPRYFLFRRFNIISVHGRLPWATHPLPHLKIKNVTPAYVDALAHYVIKKTAHTDLSTVWNFDSFKQKVENWKNLKFEDFIIALDNKDNIVGCCAPWSAHGIQEYIPLKYSLIGHNFRQFLKFGSLLGWTRKLTKPAHRLKNEESLNFRYLLSLHAENEDIFESLLWHAYENSTKKEFLVYTQIKNEIHYRRPIDWISGKIQFGNYLFSEPQLPMPDFLHPSNDHTIEMEPFFV